MTKFFNVFGKLWVWCANLLGTQNGDQEKGQNLLTDASNLLQIVQIKDVTSNVTEFSMKNLDFYRSMSARHGSSDYILNWHLMSGAAAYIPTLDSNILFERLFYSLDNGKGHRSTVDKSFIVYTPWAKDWSFPSGPTKILSVNETAGSLYVDDLGLNSRINEGPEDPRVIYNHEKDEININFNALTPNEDRQMFGSTIEFHRSKIDIEYTKKEQLIQFQHPKGYRAGVEKNWVPILIQNELHYVYSLFPLRILKCEVESESLAKSMKKKKFKKNGALKDVSENKKTCRVKFKGESVDKGTQTGALRSGSNWVEYMPGVYFSFARTRIMHPKCPGGAIYRPNLVILKFNINEKTGEYTDPHVLTVSKHVTEFNDHLFGLYENKGLSSAFKCDDEAVLTPGSISNWTGISEDENSDLADVIISVNDDMNVLVKIKGLGRTVQAALDSAPSSKQALSITKKGTLVTSAEHDLRKFVEKTFSRKHSENSEES